MLGLHLAAGGVQEVPSYLPNVLGGRHIVLDTARPMAGGNEPGCSTMEMPLDLHAARVVIGHGQETTAV